MNTFRSKRKISALPPIAFPGPQKLPEEKHAAHNGERRHPFSEPDYRNKRRNRADYIHRPRPSAREDREGCNIFTTKEIRNFRRSLARRIRHLKSVQIEMDRLPDVNSIRSSFRELQTEMDWARIQFNVCGNMLKVRKSDN